MALEDRLTIATPEGVDVDLVLAGLGSRFVARLLDSAIQAGAIFALGLTLGVSVSLFDPTAGAGGYAAAVFVLGTFLVLFVYDVVFETLASGRTPGKRAAGIRVVRLGGQPVGFLASLVRNFLRLADLLPAFYGIGIVVIVASARNQRLGDLAAGTVVVREHSGGRGAGARVAEWGRATTVPPAAVAAWDVSAITPADLNAVRRFLDRRLALPADARARLGADLAARLAPKVAGAPAGVHPEYVLEGIVVAKAQRR